MTTRWSVFFIFAHNYIDIGFGPVINSTAYFKSAKIFNNFLSPAMHILNHVMKIKELNIFFNIIY
jgi:hypothetical protein